MIFGIGLSITAITVDGLFSSGHWLDLVTIQTVATAMVPRWEHVADRR